MVPSGYGHDHPRKQLGGAAHHVLMPQGDRIEGSWVDSNHGMAGFAWRLNSLACHGLILWQRAAAQDGQ